MNHSMYLQQVHYQIKDFKIDIDYEKKLEDLKKGNWRPFQLAFILLNIKSFLEPDSDERKIMDLIWFPQVAVKQKLIGSYQLHYILRKLNSKDEKGCAVLMRYTLRLLTTQQFQRAASLICACELIRRKNSNLLGEEKISLGLWIGKESTPNKENEASQSLTELFLIQRILQK